MSILEVKNLSHGFGDRAIFEDVSFRLLKGEHIGLVGANGEGKSTFMSIVTGKMLPDEGKVEWSKYVTAGYLDQHSVLAEGQSVRDVLRTAFDELFKAEARINDLYMEMAEDGADVDALMEEVGELQDRLESRDFYTLDAKIDEVARALGVMDFGMDTDVTSLSGGQRTKVLLAKLLLEKPDILLLDEPTNYEIWPCLVRRNWIRWILSNSKVRNQNHPLISNQLVRQGALSSKPRICRLVMTDLLLSL